MLVFNELSVIQSWEVDPEHKDNFLHRLIFLHNTVGGADLRLIESLNQLTFVSTDQFDKDCLFLKGN